MIFGSDESLEKFYKSIYIACEKKVKKIVEGSVIKTLLGLTSNNRYNVLNNSALPSYKIDRHSLENLVEKGFVRSTDNVGYHTITAKGLWEIETKKKVLDENGLIEFLDEKKFNPYKSAEKPLDKREKIILFFMIATRAFSEKSAIDIKGMGEIAKTKLKDVINKSAEKLASMEFIPKIEDESDIYGKVGNEPLGGGRLLRRADKLPKKTGGMYKSLGEYKYFLELYEEKVISKDKLKLLFQKIFGDKILTPNQVNELNSFFKEISFEYSIYLFNPTEHIFSNPEYDEVLRESLALL